MGHGVISVIVMVYSAADSAVAILFVCVFMFGDRLTTYTYTTRKLKLKFKQQCKTSLYCH